MPRTTPLEPLQVRNKADSVLLSLLDETDRLLARVPEHGTPSPLDLARLSGEFELFIDVLNRLVRLAHLTTKEGLGGKDLRQSLKAFKASAPGVRELRDTVEHFDAYSLGKGKRQEQKGESLSDIGFTVHPDQVVVRYASFNLPIQKTTAAARELHRAIRLAVDEKSRADPDWHEALVDIGGKYRPGG